MSDSEFPKFYDVNDTIVRLDLDEKTDEVYGTVMLTGKPYPIYKPLVEGHAITEQEAQALVSQQKEAASQRQSDASAAA